MSQSNQANNYTDFFYKAFRNILLVSIPLVIVLGLVLISLHSSASTDQIEFSLSVSCTMSSIVNSAHTKEITNGTYHSDVGKTTITALCNDGNGYTVYATGYSNDEVGNNKLVNTTNSQYSIDTGLATSGLTSTWAMKLNNLENDPSSTPPVIESAYNDTYGLVPNNWTKVASRQSGTTDMNLGSSFTTTYSIYTSSSQFAGTYRGQVKYALIHPYSNDKYIYYMQEIDSWKDTLALEESLQATDIRDGKKYWVTKLKDGNIWMTQNLDFDINANTTLNSNTTDLNVIYDSSTGKYAEYNNGYTANNDIIYWTPASSAITIYFQNTEPITGWQDSDTAPYSANKTDSTETSHASLGNWYNWTAAIASNNSSSLTQDALSDISKNPKNSICPKGWRLPTISNQSNTASGSTNEFARLNYLYNNNQTGANSFDKLMASPLFFANNGTITSGIYNDTFAANYHSSTSQNNSQIYTFVFDSTRVLPTAPRCGRQVGRGIRCVAK